MAYDESLAQRIRDALARTKGVVEKKMFGGLIFMLHGNMLVGVWKEALIARVGKDSYEDALREEHAGVFDATGRPMKGWILVDPEGLEDDSQIDKWIGKAKEFVEMLPMK